MLWWRHFEHKPHLRKLEIWTAIIGKDDLNSWSEQRQETWHSNAGKPRNKWHIESVCDMLARKRFPKTKLVPSLPFHLCISKERHHQHFSENFASFCRPHHAQEAPVSWEEGCHLDWPAGWDAQDSGGCQDGGWHVHWQEVCQEGKEPPPPLHPQEGSQRPWMLTQRQMANTTLDPPVFNLPVLDPPVLSFSRLLSLDTQHVRTCFGSHHPYGWKSL